MYSKFRSYYCRNFALVVSYASEGGFNDLTLNENSKILHIDPNYTEESGDSKNDTSGSFNNKFSSLLFIVAGLLL